MRKLFTILLCAAFMQPNAQTWHLISPQTGFTSLNDLSMPYVTQGMAVGTDGTILYYDGSGWMLMENNLNEKLNAVHMLTSGKAWAVGENGTVLFNNGSEWAQQNTPSDAVLNDVHMLNDSLGWAVGGTILRYDGSEWLVEKDEAHLNAIHLYDETEGWIVGNYGRTLKYDGNEWSIVTNSPMDLVYEDVVMTGSSTGWRTARSLFGGGPGAGIYEYNGNNWFYSGSGEVRTAYGLAYSDHNNGWAIHNQTMPVIGPQSIYQITNEYWSKSKNINYWDRLTGIAAPDLNNAFACTQNGFIYHYKNNHWNISNGFADQTVYDMDFSSSYNGRVTSGNMGIMRIENGTWYREFSDEPKYFKHVLFIDEDAGWATAYSELNEESSHGSSMYKYLNGHWEKLFDFGIYPIDEPGAIFAIDQNNVWLGTWRGRLYRWNGQIWSMNSISGLWNIKAIYFSDPQNGFIAGSKNSTSNGLIMQYQSGVWNTVFETEAGTVNAFHFFDDGTAWAVGNGGGIYYYDGNVWTDSASTINIPLYAIEMIDQQNGWAAGHNGVLLHFNGEAWNLYEQNLGKTIYSICFPEPDFGLMGGAGGAVFSTELQLPVGMELPEKHLAKSELIVYPNPATNICYIRIPEDFCRTGKPDFLVNLYNSQGILVQQTRRKSGDEIISLDTGHLAPGLYLLQITDGNLHHYYAKLLVQ